MNGTTKENLAKEVTGKTLGKYFDEYLNTPPMPEKKVEKTNIWIKIDAQYYGRSFCIVLVKVKNKFVYWRHFKRETFSNYLKVLSDLTRLGYKVQGITSDWHGSLVGTVKYLYGGKIPHQRCLVHTQRRCQGLLTQKPKLEAGKQLLEIVRALNQISNRYESNIWSKWLERWGQRWKRFANQRSFGRKEDGSRTWWYTHKNLRAAFRTLKSSQDNLFLYLEYNELDKDTNGLEGEFSHLKQKANSHRGLKMIRKISAIYWYIYLKNLERNR